MARCDALSSAPVRKSCDTFCKPQDVAVFAKCVLLPILFFWTKISPKKRKINKSTSSLKQFQAEVIVYVHCSVPPSSPASPKPRCNRRDVLCAGTPTQPHTLTWELQQVHLLTQHINRQKWASRDGRSASTLPDFPTETQRDMTVADHGSLALTNSSVSLSMLHWAVVSQRHTCPLTRHMRRAPAAVASHSSVAWERIVEGFEGVVDLFFPQILDCLHACLLSCTHLLYLSSCVYRHICCIYPPFFFLAGGNLCHVTHVLLHKHEQNWDPLIKALLHSTTTEQRAPRQTF